MEQREQVIGEALLFASADTTTKIFENYRADNPKCASEYNLTNITHLAFVKDAVFVALNRWTRGSGLYDVDESTANLYVFNQRYKENPDSQYIVEVSFHS